MFIQKDDYILLDEVRRMDMKRKKELLQEWKNRHPEMGVISFYCNSTGEAFLGIIQACVHKGSGRLSALWTCT